MNAAPDTLRDLPDATLEMPASTARPRPAGSSTLTPWTIRASVPPAPLPANVIPIHRAVRTMESATPAPPALEPDWLREARDKVWKEIRGYFLTAWSFAVRPNRTAASWADGSFRAQNPLAYLLNSLLLVGPWRVLCQQALGMPGFPLWVEALHSISPFLTILVSGSVTHLFFRLFGSKRTIASTWGVSIYAAGGLATLTTMILEPIHLRLAAMSPILQSQHPLDMKTWAHPAATAMYQSAAYWQNVGLTYVGVAIVSVVAICAQAGLHGMTRKRSALVHLLSIGFWFVAGIVPGCTIMGLRATGRLLGHYLH